MYLTLLAIYAVIVSIVWLLGQRKLRTAKNSVAAHQYAYNGVCDDNARLRDRQCQLEENVTELAA